MFSIRLPNGSPLTGSANDHCQLAELQRGALSCSPQVCKMGSTDVAPAGSMSACACALPLKASRQVLSHIVAVAAAAHTPRP